MSNIAVIKQVERRRNKAILLMKNTLDSWATIGFLSSKLRADEKHILRDVKALAANKLVKLDYATDIREYQTNGNLKEFRAKLLLVKLTTKGVKKAEELPEWLLETS